MPARRWTALLALAALVPAGASAQGLEYVRAHYTKYDYRIPMRDGTKLFTSVYVPKDASPTNRYPILMQRTPYSVAPYGIDRYRENLGPSPLFGKAGYIVAYQDVRGRYLSEGDFVEMRPQVPDKAGEQFDESSDTYDTIDWLVENVRHNNGKVGVWGISWPGTFAANAIIDAHPALKAASPQAPMTDWFLGDDIHHNGALFLLQEFGFEASFGGPPREKPSTKSGTRFDYGTPDGYNFFLDLGPLSNVNERHFKGEHAWWDAVLEHETYDDFWKSRAILPHIQDVKPAVLTVGGWFDAEDLYGPLNLYKRIEETSEGANTLVMGPWVHGGWSRGDGDRLGPVRFASKTAEFYRETIEFPFFERHLKGKDAAEPAEAWMFETGRNEWHALDAWPPPDSAERSLYFLPGGKLAFDPPADSGGDGYDEYRSDPAKPVPYSMSVSTGYARDYPVEDQRFAARRPDVLVYQTEPLEADVTLAGPITADLLVSTTGTDADWVVKLIDVYPDDHPDPEPNPAGVRMGGYQQLVRGEVMRGKFRDSFEDPAPFDPGVPTPVKFAVQDVYHTFRPGHRIMVQVQSTWFPLVDRNPQTFVNISEAKASDYRPATQRVYRAPGKASRLVVRAVDGMNGKQE